MKDKLKTLVILSIISLLSLSFTFSHWEGSIFPPSKIVSMSGVNIGKYLYRYPNGGTVIPEGKMGYTPGDVFVGKDPLDPDNNIFYETLKKCNKGEGCVKPGEDQNGWQVNFEAITHLWNKINKYNIGDVVIQNGRAFKPLWDNATNSLNGPAYNIVGWIELGTIAYNKSHYYSKGSFLLKDGLLYRLNNDLYHGAVFPTWPGATTLQSAYFKDKAYSIGEAVLYQGGVYKVIDAKSASENEPGTSIGAWKRIDKLNWNKFNLYQTGDVVVHNGLYYIAIANNLVSEPDTLVNTWSALETGNYRPYNTYLKGQYVIEGNILYKNILQSSGVKPGDSGSELYWKKVQ